MTYQHSQKGNQMDKIVGKTNNVPINSRLNLN